MPFPAAHGEGFITAYADLWCKTALLDAINHALEEALTLARGLLIQIVVDPFVGARG
jgi:hypothetical protein